MLSLITAFDTLSSFKIWALAYDLMNLLCMGRATHWHSVDSACTGPRWILHTGHTRRDVLGCKAGSRDPLLVVHWARQAPPPSRCPPQAAPLHPGLAAPLPGPALASEGPSGVEVEGGPTRCHRLAWDPSARWAHNLTCWDRAKLTGMIQAQDPVFVVIVVVRGQRVIHR